MSLCTTVNMRRVFTKGTGIIEKTTSQARQSFSETVDLALKGEITVLTRNTVPVAAIVPIADLVRISAQGRGRRAGGQWGESPRGAGGRQPRLICSNVLMVTGLALRFVR